MVLIALRLSLFVSMLVAVRATHFRGGSVYWQTTKPIVNGSGIQVSVTQRFAWRRSVSSPQCDNTLIGSGTLFGQGEGNLICVAGCVGISSLGSAAIYCTDYNIIDDWMVGERTFAVTLPYVPVFEASFSSCCWISTLVVGRDGGWEVRTKFNFQTVVARRNYNASPKTKMPPIINWLYGCNHTIAIPVVDDDGDNIRCRWSTSNQRECGDICNAFPNAVLDGRSCTLSYSATRTAGLYAVALQIEDFYDQNETQPLSSVPLQFIINVYLPTSINDTCYSKPIFVWPTRPNGACVAIHPNATFNESFVAQSANPSVTITDIDTQSPIGVKKSALTRGSTADTWYVTITWTPAPNQFGNSIFCYLVRDSTGASSDQSCITFAVGSYAPSIVNDSQYPVGKVLPNNGNWRIKFDRPFIRPRASAYIRFYDNIGNQIFTIDTSTSNNVLFPSSTNETYLNFSTFYVFLQKKSYYITVDNGVVSGTNDCGPESVGILYDPTFWRIYIKDITPPVLTFTKSITVSNGNASFAWIYDESTNSTCTLQKPSNAFVNVVCNTSVSLTDLPEGYNSLFIQATDNEDNSKQYVATWYVDLTPPTVTLYSYPSVLTNKKISTFFFYCNDFSVCTLRCAVKSTGAQPIFSSCSNSYTTSSLADGQYTFLVSAIDSVGNGGAVQSYSWTVDSVPPAITALPNITRPCGSPYDPTVAGIPSFADDVDVNPSLKYVDSPSTNCQTIRTWTAIDHAGNVATSLQTITFVNILPPSIGVITDLFVPCGETEKLASSAFAIQSLKIDSLCARPISVNYTDSALPDQCGITITRQWLVSDDCGSAVRFNQKINILTPSDPDFPANGQTNIDLFQAVGWPTYPGSLGYNIYLWPFGSVEPNSSTAMLPVWQRQYRPSVAYPPNTQLLWRVGYIVRYGNGTIEIPGPVWGFKTLGFADLQVTALTIPPTVFSGKPSSVTWTVANIGNVSTSQSTDYFVDAIYLSRGSTFTAGDAVLRVSVRQERYVDPGDSYTSTAIVNLLPTDLGRFYVFIVVDLYKQVTDFAPQNNIIVSKQTMNVQLTPPPNLVVTSVVVVGLVASGKSADIRYVVQNIGTGITDASTWTDALFLSPFEQRNSSAKLLLRVPHNGALASGSQYVTSIAVSLPNAIFGEYNIIVSTDIDNRVFENNNENDNDLFAQASIILSPYPDLTVTQITCQQFLRTGDTLTANVTVVNSGFGAPFETYWTDSVWLSSADGSIDYFKDSRPIYVGQQLVPASLYSLTFTYNIAPALTTGYYNITAKTDKNDEVFEYQSKQNNQRNIQIYVTQELPDLIASLTLVSVTGNTTGNYLLYNALLTNMGIGSWPANSYWQSQLYLVADNGNMFDLQTSLATDYTIIDRQRVNMNGSVRIPTSIYGNYSVRLLVDSLKQVLESNEANNVALFGGLVIQKHESYLTVVNMSIPSSAYSGDQLTISWTVRNTGDIATRSSYSWQDEVALSINGLRRALLTTLFVSLTYPLFPLQSYEFQARVSIPNGLVGRFNVDVTTAKQFTSPDKYDTNITVNQRSQSIMIMTPPSPDLKPVMCGYEISLVSTVRFIVISCTIENIGNSMETAKNWSDHFSLVNGLRSEALGADKNNNRKLLSSEVYSAAISLVIPPTVNGYFQLKIQIDAFSDVLEIGGEDNNVFILPQSIFIAAAPSPILSAVVDALTQSTFLSGTPIIVHCTVSNTGVVDLSLSSWTDSIYLFHSPDASRRQVLLYGFQLSSVIQNRKMPVGASYTLTFQGLLPYFSNQVMYLYIVIDINDKLPLMSNERATYLNNSIFIEEAPLPDLQVNAYKSVILSVQSGMQYNITFTVINSANVSATGVWYDSIYLSKDNVLDPFDTILKSEQNPSSLLGMSNYSHSILAIIPYDLPAQSYYLIVATNVRRSLIEYSYDDNYDYKPLTILILPAVDLVVTDVNTDKQNVTYGDSVTFDWNVGNNGSLQAFGRKCDSVYLSQDASLDITDLAIVESTCGNFDYGPKLRSRYRSTQLIPPVAAGLYNTIVRTRSNLRDVNLANNIGVSLTNMSIKPPQIALNEVRTITLLTNQQVVFYMTGIPTGIGLVVKLVTGFEFAYHSLFIKQNMPPKTNNYDFKSKQLVTQQRVSVPSTNSGPYYLLVVSDSAMADAFYQVTLIITEAKFEIASVFPSVLPVGQSSTLAVTGNLFGVDTLAYLMNDTFRLSAKRVYRYTSEELYITFDCSKLSAGNFSLELIDQIKNSSFENKNAVTVSNVAPIGKFIASIITPSVALRAGSNGTLQFKIGNSGNSDIEMSVVLLSTDGNSKLLSTDADRGSLPSTKIAFIPTVMNKPSTVIVPLSTEEFSFTIIPNNANFIGVEGLHLSLVDDINLLKVMQQIVIALKPQSTSAEKWEVVVGNVNKCLNTKPNYALSQLNGHMTQHYAAFHSVDNLAAHLIEIVDGTVPPFMLVQSVDLADELYAGPLQLKVIRGYSHQLTVRRSSGPFGKGWSCYPIELSINHNGSTVYLLKQRRLFIFQADNNSVYKSLRLPNDYIKVNKTHIVYVSDSLVYTFAESTHQLVMVRDLFETDTILFTYDASNLLSNMNHSNGNTISLTYNADKLIVRAELFQLEVSISQVFYAYNSDDTLVTVSKDNKFSVYQYTIDGDLKSSRGSDSVTTTFTYDALNLLNSTTTLINTRVVQQVITQRGCDGTVDTIIYPENTTLSVVYGLGGSMIEMKSPQQLPVSYVEDAMQRLTYTSFGGDSILHREQFDTVSRVYTISEGDTDVISLQLNDAAQIIQLADNQGPYYNATYYGNLLTRLDYRDGTSRTFTYNKRKQLASDTLRDGSAIRYDYDSEQRVRSKDTIDGRFTYTVSNDGLLFTVHSPDGSATAVKYNSDKLPISVSNPDGTRINYEYNECKLRKSLTSNNGYNCTYLYDDRCRLISVKDGDGSMIAEFTYRDDNTLLDRILGNGMRTQYAFEPNSQRLSTLQSFYPNGTLLSAYNYTYNSFGYLMKTESRSEVWTYRYDSVGQLVEWASPQVDSQGGIDYDVSSNRKSKQTSTGREYYTSNPMNQYTSYGDRQSLAYDKNGNTIQKKTVKHGSVETEQYAYNQEGRVTQIKTGTATCDYKFDVFGAISSKSCSDGTSIKYLNDPFGEFGSSILSETFANNNPQFIYHGMQHGLIAAKHINQSRNSLYFLFDGEGSATYKADESGRILNSYSYDPFGMMLNMSTNTDTNTFRYLAQFGVKTVNETQNIIFMRNRLYDAEHGRFMSPDPINGFSSPTNPYVYANNNPFLFKDPNGLSPVLLAGAIVGGVYGGITAAWGSRNSDWRSLAGHTVGGIIGGAVAGTYVASGGGILTSAVGGALGTYANRVVCDSISSSSCDDINLLTGVQNSVYNIFPTSFYWLKDGVPGNGIALAKLLSRKTVEGRSFWYTYGVSTELSLAGAALTSIVDWAIPWIRSLDPNEIYGPSGYGDTRFISMSEQLEFKIEFENDPDATAPAQIVRIDCVLDAGLDLATFQVGMFAFSNYSYNAGYVSNFAPYKVITSETTGMHVRLEVIKNALDYKITWLLATKDASGLTPNDASIGFLPPNNGTTGQGYVTFRIKLRNGVNSLQKINANATIIFDQNPPISTKTIFNTIDTVPPSKVNINVNINGTYVPDGVLMQFLTDDIGSGVKSIDLYNVINTAPKLIKSDISSSDVLVHFGTPPTNTGGGVTSADSIIYLDKGVNYLLTAVATDFVNNRRQIDVSNVTPLSFSINCPSQCSGHGWCLLDGCSCDSQYFGIDCNRTVTEACDKPILEFDVTNQTTPNSSVVVHVSATGPPNVNSGMISIIVKINPSETTLGKGDQLGDLSWSLANSDFGDVAVHPPMLYFGYINFTVIAIFSYPNSSGCGKAIRSIDASMLVSPVTDPRNQTEANSTVTIFNMSTLSAGTTPQTHGSPSSQQILESASTLVSSQTESINSFGTDRTVSYNQTATTESLRTVFPPRVDQTSQQTMVTINSTDRSSTAGEFPSSQVQNTNLLETTVSSLYVTSSNSSLNPAGRDIRSTLHQTKLSNTTDEIATSTPSGATMNYAVKSSTAGAFLSSQTQNTNLLDIYRTMFVNQNTTKVVLGATTTPAASFTTANGTIALPNEHVTRNSYSSSATAASSGTVTNHIVELSSLATYSTVSENAGYWDAWSEWSQCTRTCDSGVRSRQRQCLSNAMCIGSNVTTETCLVSPCPVDNGETTEGVILNMSGGDARQVLLKLETFYDLIATSANSFCTVQRTRCCTVLLSTSNVYSTSLVKIILKVDIDVVKSQCLPVEGKRRKRQAANVNFFDKYLLTDVVAASLAILQQNLSITVLGVITPNDNTTASPDFTSGLTTDTPAVGNSLLPIASILGAAGGSIMIIICLWFCYHYQCRVGVQQTGKPIVVGKSPQIKIHPSSQYLNARRTNTASLYSPGYQGRIWRSYNV